MIARIYVVISCKWFEDLIIIQQTAAIRKVVGKADFKLQVSSDQINVTLSSYSAFNKFISLLNEQGWVQKLHAWKLIHGVHTKYI